MSFAFKNGVEAWRYSEINEYSKLSEFIVYLKVKDRKRKGIEKWQLLK